MPSSPGDFWFMNELAGHFVILVVKILFTRIRAFLRSRRVSSFRQPERLMSCVTKTGK